MFPVIQILHILSSTSRMSIMHVPSFLSFTKNPLFLHAHFISLAMGFASTTTTTTTTTIKVVRNEIKEFAGTRQLFSKGVKLIILDEADAMTNDAQNALRRIVEKYTKNARFCLICNYVSKIIPALQSRCTRFRFAPLSKQQIYGRLVEVAKEEKVDYTENGLEAILSLSGGDMRQVSLSVIISIIFRCELYHILKFLLTIFHPIFCFFLCQFFIGSQWVTVNSHVLSCCR